VIAGLLLVAMAFPTAGPAQFPNLLFLFWVLAASIKMSRVAAPGMLPSVRTSQPIG
jgi:hypothetical protein